MKKAIKKITHEELIEYIHDEIMYYFEDEEYSKSIKDLIEKYQENIADMRYIFDQIGIMKKEIMMKMDKIDLMVKSHAIGVQNIYEEFKYLQQELRNNTGIMLGRNKGENG